MSEKNPKRAKKNLDFVRTWLYPELRCLTRADDRDALMNLAVKRVNQQHRVSTILALAAGPFLVLLYLLALIYDFLDDFLDTPYRLGLIFPLTVGPPFFAMFLKRRSVRIELRRLLKRDFWCHKCDYFLKDNATGRCPECGTAIEADQQGIIREGAHLASHQPPH